MQKKNNETLRSGIIQEWVSGIAVMILQLLIKLKLIYYCS
jgi:hypothetical protein